MDRKRAFKLRFRRQLRMQRRQVGEFSASAEQRLEDDFFKRLERLGSVKRFILSWLLLVVLLIGCVVTQTRALSGYYQHLVPVPGGTYTEGILGSFTNANPLYATGLVDTSVSRLLFAGLLTYDNNNQLASDLASDWSVNSSGTAYTVHLWPKLTWQDGRPLTASDVVFTYQVIQNPDARSPLYTSWQGIKVTAPNATTVTFTLPNPLASFPYSLTTGIVPQHILGSVPMDEMRSDAFNTTHPVGAGPFQWQALQLTGGSADTRQEHIALKPFAHYHGGKPKLNSFVVRTFRGTDQLVKSFQNDELNAVVGLTAVPEQLKNDKATRIYNLPLTAAVMSFFRTSQGVLADASVRKALIQGADTTSIIQSLDYATLPVREPLLHGQIGYNPAYQQAGYDPTAAGALLDGDGWLLGKDRLRHKGTSTLSFQLEAQNSGEYPSVARQLAKQWRAIGANVQVVTAQDDATFQSSLSYHTYDAVLYGISIGPDPDVFVYWDSSQADVRAPVRLNLSEYKSAQADNALEAGRTRLDPALRAIKYQSFLQAWQADAPALGLYQPRFLYITHGTVNGLDQHPINSDIDRFTNVQNWEVRQAKQADT
ncbi:MAG TPA: peptide ABC transporter substrate-binding protein [Candidatus Saccharimonadales bacterium]|nr:peptide ABC transporter substrate-binding protein [Candidatus Saccharimonadales bacterium]